jgi:hypothetical protein
MRVTFYLPVPVHGVEKFSMKLEAVPRRGESVKLGLLGKGVLDAQRWKVGRVEWHVQYEADGFSNSATAHVYLETP